VQQIEYSVTPLDGIISDCHTRSEYSDHQKVIEGVSVLVSVDTVRTSASAAAIESGIGCWTWGHDVYIGRPLSDFQTHAKTKSAVPGITNLLIINNVS
jgi:hypothetical protein